MAMAPRTSFRPHEGVVLLVVATLLVAAVAVIYAPVRHAPFMLLDDPGYITENPYVRGGLTAEGLGHAFFGSRAALWMPLAFTSHMLDVELFGLDPGPPHLVNIALHAANAVLLLLLFVRATGALAPSAAVAVLFALHPLRVESVAWIAERKDVLSVFFGLLTLHAWVSYARAPGLRRYGAVVAGTVLALLSKPMMVTLPVLLLLFDHWPLHRLGTARANDRPVTIWRLVTEKIPLLLLALATATITILAAHSDKSLVALDARPLGARVAHALVSYVWYAWKTAWPTNLAVFYPFPTWAPWQVAGAAVTVALAGMVAVATSKRAPWVVVGLAWFVVGLAPVIGIFQAGSQGMADRFAYLPSIGLLVAGVWTLHATVRSPARRTAFGVATVLAASALATASARQVTYWRDGVTLLERSLAVTESSATAHGYLGNALAEAHRPAEALTEFSEALRLEPRDSVSAFGLGVALEGLDRPDDAIKQYREALRIDPTYGKAHNNLGVLLLTHDDTEGALHHFSEAAQFDPTSDAVAANLRLALGHLGVADADADRYMRGIRMWSAAISDDSGRPGGAEYGKALPGQLLGTHVDALRACVGTAGGSVAPFNLYVTVNADGALAEVAAVPPTRIARCLRDELRAAQAPMPPFAPFHGQVTMQFQG